MDASRSDQGGHADHAEDGNPADGVELQRPPFGPRPAASGREQDARPGKITDPGRSRDEVQDIGGKVQISQFPQGRAGMPGPGDRRDQSETNRERTPARERKAVEHETGRHQDGEASANFRDQAKLGLVDDGEHRTRPHRFVPCQTHHRHVLLMVEANRSPVTGPQAVACICLYLGESCIC